MSFTLILPPLNDPATEFVVEQYYVTVNDAVVAGQPFALVRSERWAWDVPATADGTVNALVAEPGSTVALGAPLIELREDGPTTRVPHPEGTRCQRPTTNDESIDGGEQETQNREQIDQNQRLKRPSLVKEPQSESILAQLRVRATPVAQRMIMAHGLDLAALSGTGRGNVVTRADVLAVIREQGAGNKEQKTINGQQTVVVTEQDEDAAQVAPDSQSSIRNLQFAQPSNLPYALTAIEVDLATAVATVAQHQARWARRGVTLSATACVAAASVAALGEHPLLHSAWHDDGIILRGRVQLAVEHRTTGEHQRTYIPHAADLNAAGIARRLAHAAHHEEIEPKAATFVIM